jgi:hypothetical protein
VSCLWTSLEPVKASLSCVAGSPYYASAVAIGSTSGPTARGWQIASSATIAAPGKGPVI